MIERVLTCLETYWKIWSVLFGVGLLVIVWRILKMIFRRILYPNDRLKRCIEILPRSTGIQFIGDKLYLYFTVINLSWIYNLKVEIIEALAGCYELKKFRIEEPMGSFLIKRNSISIARMERDLNEKEKEYFLREFINRDGVTIKIKAKIFAFNWFFGDRIIEEKIFQEATVLVRK